MSCTCTNPSVPEPSCEDHGCPATRHFYAVFNSPSSLASWMDKAHLVKGFELRAVTTGENVFYAFYQAPYYIA